MTIISVINSHIVQRITVPVREYEGTHLLQRCKPKSLQQRLHNGPLIEAITGLVVGEAGVALRSNMEPSLAEWDQLVLLCFGICCAF